jgi:TatD DNase family protein
MTFSLIDTHCHLEMDEFNSDREDVIERARNAGIEAIITISSDIESNIKGLELSEKYDFIYSSVGIHPHDAKDFTEEIFNQIKEWIHKFEIRNSKFEFQKAKVVAIGEIGLD